LQITGEGVPASGAGLELSGSASGTGITSFNRSLGTFLSNGFNALQYTFLTSGVEQMRLTSTGLGIGTSSPVSRIDARSASAVIGNYQQIQAFSTDTAAINLGGGISLGGYYSGVAGLASFGTIVGRKENGTDGNYAGYLAFGTNAQATGVVERARIDSSGNLLVSTTTLNYAKLVVLGATSTPSLTVGTTATAIIAGGSGQELAITESGTAPYAIGLQARNSTGAPSGTSYPILLNPLGGNVGIGTIEPLSKLNIDIGNISGTLGQANQSNILLGNAGASAGNLVQMLFGYVTSAVTYAPAALGFVSTSAAGNTKGDLIFGTRDVTTDTAPSERLRITSAGNVGIGTNNPNKLLTVNSATNDVEVLRINVNGGAGGVQGKGDIGFGFYDTVDEASAAIGFEEYLTSSAGGNLLFKTRPDGAAVSTRPTERMRISEAGLVGIGTNAPNAKLTVWTPSTTGLQTALRLNNPFGFANINTGAQIVFSQDRSTAEDLPQGSIGVGQESPGSSVNAYMAFSTNSSGVSEKMRITAAGNLLVGTTTSSQKLTVAGALALTANSGTANTSYGTVGLYTGGTIPVTYIQMPSGGATEFWKPDTGAAVRIDSSGNLLVGTTSTISAFNNKYRQVINPVVNASAQYGLMVNANANAYTQYAVVFADTYSEQIVGSITFTTSATAYNTSSDYRLKDNIAPMTNALAKVAQLKPVTYKWKLDGSNGEGFIAHELAEVVPQCVTGEKDAVDEEGNPQYQGIDTSFLVATLTAAIQEQQALITQLQADIATLKG
jgi:hypothetical protein